MAMNPQLFNRELAREFAESLLDLATNSLYVLYFGHLNSLPQDALAS